jgi:hypothetical protein
VPNKKEFKSFTLINWIIPYDTTINHGIMAALDVIFKFAGYIKTKIKVPITTATNFGNPFTSCNPGPIVNTVNGNIRKELNRFLWITRLIYISYLIRFV